ncbi:hypothetical protein ACAG26_18925 [Mycobacterium sp. pUA109]|uniref:hypothetical protein n=1 Tax=Mycobacterium sp. pUA109 TaxID=3238982 RepID=UPI00351B47A3
MSYDTDDDDDDDDIDEPKPNNNLKWGLAAVIVLAVVAIVLVAVVLFGGDTPKDSTGLAPSTPSSGADTAGIASAQDTGPVRVITEDPSCTAWTGIDSNLVGTLAAIGGGKWNERDQSIPASAWDDEQRKLNMAAAQVLRTTAAQTVGLVKLTPHRVMRELYEQFIAYARTYGQRVQNYTPKDSNLVATANSAAATLAEICNAITDGPAAVRGPLVEPAPAPNPTAPVGNPNNPMPYLPQPNDVCAEWKSVTDKFAADTAEWQQLDPNIPATFWNPQQKAVNSAVGMVMNSYSKKMQQLGLRSDNPILQDFADLAAQYRNAFVFAIPTYEVVDQHLANASTYASMTVMGACAAVAPAR